MKKLIEIITASIVAFFSFSLLLSPALAQTDDGYDYGDPSTTYDDYYTTSVNDQAAANAIAGFSLVFWLVFCCVYLLIVGGMAFVVYNDAKKNAVENGVLWAALTFFFGLIPLLIYFLAIKKNSAGGTSAK